MRGGTAFVLAAIAFCAPGVVGAQEASDEEVDTATARTLFDEGRAAAEAEDWALAAERFRQTLALRDTAAVRYNLGVSLVRLGQFLAGITHLERATSDPAYAIAARDLIAATRPRIAHLVITVAGEVSGDVELDGRAIASELVGTSLPVDPGLRVVQLLAADGSVLSARTIDVLEGSEARVELTPELQPEPSHPPVSAEPRRDDAAGIATGTAAAATTLGGLALVIAAAWSWTDAAAALPAYEADPTIARFDDGNARADRTELLGAFAAGSLAVSSVLWVLTAQLLSADATEPPAAVTVLPAWGGASLCVRW